ncbi:MAG: redox-regulated ATPase YchF [Micrococcales bacterium]|nr:redox-regulated ATPase YchF [Micrococcales bacterium]
MALTIGIVGLPNCGKSTLFNALTHAGALATDYPYTSIEPNIGVADVPDARLGVLSDMFKSARIVPATVSFVDIAGIAKGASRGEGMGNAFLGHIRQADAICQVTQVFGDAPDDPASQIEVLTAELALADLQTLEKALPKLQKEAGLKKDLRPRLDAWLEAQAVLQTGVTVHAAGLDPEPLRDLWLLTAKPFIHVFNCDQDSLADAALVGRLQAMVAPAKAICMDAKLEAELGEMSDEDQALFREEMGVPESGLATLAHVGYATLGLQSFLTTGVKETRAWTIHQGWTAPLAAGVIHTDFQKGFIKAEIVGYDDLVRLGSMAAAKAAGKVRLEGKDYVMQEGDVVEFRFNI